MFAVSSRCTENVSTW